MWYWFQGGWQTPNAEREKGGEIGCERDRKGDGVGEGIREFMRMGVGEKGVGVIEVGVGVIEEGRGWYLWKFFKDIH